MSRSGYRRAAAVMAGTLGIACFAGAQVPCGAGTLAITSTSDTPFTPPTFNVGQKTTLTAVTTGITATSFAWTIPGPHIKDYSDDLGTKVFPALAAPRAWSTTPLSAADLALQSVSLYWKPSAAQTHPNTGGPEARTISVVATLPGGVTCTASTVVNVERNLTNAAKQPEDFYTSNHRAATATNAGFGRVVDEHIYWHQFVGAGPVGHWQQFLAWHTYFLGRFDEWRTEFGYAPVAPWYPGRPMPTGPAFDHTASLRLAFSPSANRIPTYFTLVGGNTASPLTPGVTRLTDFATLDAFSDDFESSYHGDVHCNIGAAGSSSSDFFDSDGPYFGSMCKASSPKDPLFWRWHGFINVLYGNYCQAKGITCHNPVEASADPWMADNPADVAANGTVPSAQPLWLSPDVWNRRAEVTTDACIPRDPPPSVNSVGGVLRNCGSSADHENPVAGVRNYLYATLRNTRPNSPRVVYAEVAVYIANASTGLSWPADFTMLPETRQFIQVHLEPGQVTHVGPIPWTPPSPAPSDHWCIYLRVLTTQEAPPVEGTNVGTNVANSNSIAWRNMKIEPAGTEAVRSRFIVRNIQPRAERLAIEFEVPPELLQNGRVRLRVDATLQRAIAAGKATLEGVKQADQGLFEITGGRASVNGIQLDPRQFGGAELVFEPVRGRAPVGDVVVTQRSSQGVDGGVVLRVARTRALQKR